MKLQPELSIIIPVYNAADSIQELVNELLKIYAQDYTEIVLINDGSTDQSDAICKRIAAANNTIQYIKLRRNFGEHNAVMCGLNFCKGKYAVIIDDDFQNPPSEIALLLNEASKGFDVVYSRYEVKRHELWRNAVSWINNKVANLLMQKPSNLYLSSFKIIHRDVILELIKYKGPFPYVDGLILRTTDSISSVIVRHDNRYKGKSNYTLKKLFSLFLNMFLNFSVRPLRIFTIGGALIFLLGLILSGVFVYVRITSGEYPGWTSTIIFILLLSGFQIVFLGLIGEYLGKQYLDQNVTPQWVVKDQINTELHEG